MLAVRQNARTPRTTGKTRVMAPRTRVAFIEPMLLLRTDRLPDDPARWSYQLKLDGYRAIAFKTGGKVHLRSPNDNDFSARYPKVVRGLEKLPYETVTDGELVAIPFEWRQPVAVWRHFDSPPPLSGFRDTREVTFAHV